MSIRKVAVLLGAFATMAVFAQPVGASHAGSVVDCGSAGTFTLKATQTGSGFQAPDAGAVAVFEEGGTLAIMEFSVNGQLVFSNAATGRAQRNVAEVTCSYTTGFGNVITITGVLTAR